MSAMLFRSTPQNSNPFATGLTPGSRSDEGTPGSLGGDDQKLVWDVSRMLSDNFSAHQKSLPRMLQMIKDLQATLEESRVAYNQVLQDRDQKRQQLTAAEGRLGDVQRVVQRYTVVQEPVVASDGYTYERGTIKQYLDECEASETHAYSQQTKEVLTETLIPNQSLKKLVELLKTVKPSEVPPAQPRNPIPPIRGGGDRGGNSSSSNNAVNFLEDDEYQQDGPSGSSANNNSNAGGKGDKVFHASDLEAALSSPATASSGKSSRKNNNQQSQQDDHANEQQQGGGRPKRGGNDGSNDQYENRRSRNDDNSKGGSNNNNSRGADDFSRPPPKGERTGGSSRTVEAHRLHPCLRVYGFCNFKDDCTFAKYPYDACLNNIKGKCRFGPGCKELHVNATDTKFQNPRAANNGQQQQQGGGGGGGSAPPAPRSLREKRDE